MLKIRKIQVKDYKDALSVINSQKLLYKKLFSNVELKGVGIGSFSEKDLKTLNKKNHILVGEDDEIIGLTSWRIKKNKVAWVGMLQVLPQKQKQGIGTALLQKVEHQARKQGARAIALEMQRKAFWAKNFYISNQYQKLSKKDLISEPFKGTLKKPPLKRTIIFGKRL